MIDQKSKPLISVSEVQIVLSSEIEEELMGWASCVINEAIFLSNIIIVQDLFGDVNLRYPFKHTHNGTKFFYFKPISREAGAIIREAVIEQLEKLKEL